MRKIHLLITAILLFTVLLAQGQKNIEFTKDFFPNDKPGLKAAQKAIEEGDKFYNQGDAYYSQAIPFYEAAQAFNPNNAMLNYKLGQAYLHSVYKSKCSGFFFKAFQLNPNVTKDIRYYVGKGHHLNLEFDEAINDYKAYRNTLNEKNDQHIIREVVKAINECLVGKDLVKNPVRVFIDNLGQEINSKYPEYSPFITADESMMIFTSRREGSIGGDLDQFDRLFYEDIYVSYKLGDKWQQAKNMGEDINTKNHDATAGLSYNGDKLFVFLGKKNGGDIFLCNLVGDKWSKPEALNKNINTEHHESSACLSPDEKTLYFVSDRTDLSLGGRDIFMSHKDKKGRWGEPVNLGPVINSQYDEESLYLHPDGKTLFFSSKGHKTMGGYDIFRTVFENGKWSEPENLGYPINTPDDDVFFVLAANGKTGYYSSFRSDGVGEKDIYQITFLGPEKPLVLNNEDNLIASIANPVREVVIEPAVKVATAQTTILKGIISDAVTQKPLDAEIELVDNTRNEVIATFRSNVKSGKYLVSLPSGKNYGIAVKADGYLFHSENFDIPAATDYQEVEKNIAMKNVAIGSKIVLRNIFFDFDKATLRPESTAELERLIKLLHDVPTLRIEISGHTDNKGSADYNQKLSMNRAKAVVDYLIGKGIGANRLEYKGYGLTQPIASNDTDAGRQENRRTEFKIIGK